MKHLRTLVLNQSYMPLSLFPLYAIPAEDAITRYLNGNCTVVDWYDRSILTPSRTDLKWPSVIANGNNHSFKKDIRLKKETLLYRDGCVCQYCGTTLTVSTITFDHVIPASKGGKGDWTNVVGSCKDCNNLKGDSLHPKWKPKHKPWAPSFYEMIDIRKKYPIVIDDESWRQFLPGWAADVIVKNK